MTRRRRCSPLASPRPTPPSSPFARMLFSLSLCRSPTVQSLAPLLFSIDLSLSARCSPVAAHFATPPLFSPAVHFASPPLFCCSLVAGSSRSSRSNQRRQLASYLLLFLHCFVSMIQFVTKQILPKPVIFWPDKNMSTWYG